MKTKIGSRLDIYTAGEKIRREEYLNRMRLGVRALSLAIDGLVMENGEVITLADHEGHLPS